MYIMLISMLYSIGQFEIHGWNEGMQMSIVSMCVCVLHRIFVYFICSFVCLFICFMCVYESDMGRGDNGN